MPPASTVSQGDVQNAGDILAKIGPGGRPRCGAGVGSQSPFPARFLGHCHSGPDLLLSGGGNGAIEFQAAEQLVERRLGSHNDGAIAPNRIGKSLPGSKAKGLANRTGYRGLKLVGLDGIHHETEISHAVCIVYNNCIPTSVCIVIGRSPSSRPDAPASATSMGGKRPGYCVSAALEIVDTR